MTQLGVDLEKSNDRGETVFTPIPPSLTIGEIVESPELSTQFVSVDEPGFDIVLLLGQSNMEGRGVPFSGASDPSDSRVFQYGASGPGSREITLASEPLLMVGSPSGIGPGLGFARWYAAYLKSGRRVLLVPSAKGGTPFMGVSSPAGWTWSVARTDVTNLYSSAVAQAREALAAGGPGSRIVAALWVQGETDGDNATSGATYQAELDALIAALRADLALPQLPFIIGQMVPDYLGSGTRTAINVVHESTPARVSQTAFAKGIVYANLGDNNHYSAVGERFLARALFDQYRALVVDGVDTPTSPEPPSELAAASITSSRIALRWRAAPGAIGYLVERRLTSGGAWARVWSGVSALAAITGLDTSTSYQFRVTSYNSAGAGTPSGTFTVSTAAPAVIISDTFNRADAGVLGSATSGQTYQLAGSGTPAFGIASNQAQCTGGSSNIFAVINAAVSDGRYELRFTVLGAFNRLIFRYVDINNYWMVQYRLTENSYRLYKVVASTATQIGADFTVTPASGDMVRVDLLGSSIAVRINGAVVATTIDTALVTASRFGFGTVNADAVARWDDLTLTT